MQLDPTDPFDSLIIPIVETNRRKRADYTHGGDIYSNFRETADQVGVTALDSANLLVATKTARIKALRVNDRAPMNEAVLDSYLDRTVYAILAYGLAKEAAERVEDPNESVAEYIQRTASLADQEPQVSREPYSC